MKMRKKEIGFLIGFIILVIGTLGFLTYHYIGWYQQSTKELAEKAVEAKKQAVIEAKKRQEEQALAQKEQEEKEAQVEAAKQEVTMQQAKVNYRNAYQTRLNQYQKSKCFNYDTDRYFIYDIDKNGIPELFITRPVKDGSNYRLFEIDTFDETTLKIKRLTKSSRFSLSRFYARKEGIVVAGLDQSGTLTYRLFEIKDGSLHARTINYFLINSEGGEWKKGSGSLVQYYKQFRDFYKKIENRKIPMQYRFGDTTPFDRFEQGHNSWEKDRTINGSADSGSYTYDRTLYFYPSTMTSDEEGYHVSGTLSEQLYISKETLKQLSIGNYIPIGNGVYKISSVENGIVYFETGNLCLRPSMDGIENASFYGAVPEGAYQVFYTDGRPYYSDIVSNLTLDFYDGVAICCYQTDENGNYGPTAAYIGNYFQADYSGNISYPSRGRLKLEGDLVVGFDEEP